MKCDTDITAESDDTKHSSTKDVGSISAYETSSTVNTLLVMILCEINTFKMTFKPQK